MLYLRGYAALILTLAGLFGFCVFIGAVGKSAQLGLHTWLPDAMEGPTPVSALIHAATMVTAGVFLLIRCSEVLDLNTFLLDAIIFFGATTAFFAATAGAFQYDLKRIIAYSTCSQLGYMVFACGLSNYNLALFHLANHAFFKALLFLSAGSVIHAMNDEQDLRKMGGLVNILPLTYIMFVIGSLSLAGFPFLTGFYSKDLILELSVSGASVFTLFAFILGLLGAFLTAFYSMRLVWLAFLSEPRGFRNVYMSAHEPSYIMLIPLLVLVLGAIFVGFVGKDMFVGLGSDFFGGVTIFNNEQFHSVFVSEFIPAVIKNIPFFVSMFGILLCILFFNDAVFKFFVALFLKQNLIRDLFSFFNKKWYFDVIYNKVIVYPVLKISYFGTFKAIDRGLLEIFGGYGFNRLFSSIFKFITALQSGYIYNYISFMIFGLVMFLSVVLFFNVTVFLLICLKLIFFSLVIITR
jgi:proton-translocating NADH-quinone oxidoreductase chain L